MLLSCSAITPAMAADRHGNARHHGNSHTPAPTPQAPPTAALPPAVAQSPQTETGLPDAVLLQGLPSSWRATLMDPPSATTKTSSGPAPSTASASGRPPPPPTPSSQQSDANASSPDTPSMDRILLPVPPRMGLAAFQSGSRFIIVIDNAEPMDTSALRGTGIFSTLTVNTLPDATLIQLRVPDTRRLYLSQQAEGWVLGDKPPPAIDYEDRRVINPQYVEDGTLYPMRRSGRVISITDPTSGRRLLVGTSTMDDGGILSLREGDGYEVWPTTEGVVISAQSPRIDLRPVPNGMLLTEDGKAFLDHGRAVYASDVDLKWLGLRDLPLDALMARYNTALHAAADSTPADRFDRRLDAAKAAFNLGSFVETRGIMTIALQDDPEEASRPDVRFLLAAAELLCGDVDGASLLTGPWPQNDKRATQFWRGLYLAALRDDHDTAARLLARDFTRIKSYPQPVREVILPVAAEEIARYGTPEDLTVLNSLPPDAQYQLVDAFRQLRSGNRNAAYATFQKLEDNRNPLVAEKAIEQKASMDLASGHITPGAAANLFSTLLPDARLAGREAAVRLLLADAYMRDRRWSDALQSIDAARSVPQPAPPSAIAPALFQALSGVAQTPPSTEDKESLLRAAAMLKAHVSDLPPGEKRADILVAYGRMLSALGLPDDAALAFSDAIPLLESPALRAAAGIALAQVDLERKLPQDALKVLDVTDDPNLPDDIKTTRRIMTAQIALANGDTTKTLSVLHNDTSPQSLDITARIHEGKGEWAAAARDVRRLAEATIPESGSLSDDQQALALRVASDASQAADRPLLDWITSRIGGRPLDGDRQALFNLLTKPVSPTLAVSQ
ncbi:hypothetical protein HLH27_00840 [Gluconacetobacter takamatsuzukensis]|uniref:Tetratricopeptide repeat-containing protein n=2 Tax=Gluconacetobacter takamatsuzukensis TaxID=1286190 RepID=A0A7W4KAZ7_9PROT|nr:hypothetical protein [Gluconacetobacter takamatsuzukensis]